MRVNLLVMIWLLTSLGMAQTDRLKSNPSVKIVPIEQGAVSVLHLRPGYATSIRLPEEITSVVIGDPSRFKAEHSEAEPRLVFLKPITTQPAESDALITSKSGQQIILDLVSVGTTSENAKVDFFVDYRSPHTLLIDSENQTFLIAEVRPVSLMTESDLKRTQEPDVIAKELERQQHVSWLRWEGKQLLAALGESIRHDQRTIVGFSVRNDSQRVMELLLPQLQLTGTRRGRKRIKAEPIAVSECRMTTRRLAPGERADGVVVFERPAFKESTEQLQLQL
ncbi:MAG: hypothetical protein DMG60_21750, partial [Acidobacteria bacterium]